MYGYMGKMCEIDLTTEKVTIEATPSSLINDYLGGRGFVAKILYERLKPSLDPLGEENLLVFSVGPLAGTIAPSSGRWTVGSKSPATGYINIGNAGGFWGTEFKWSGFDVLIIRGQARQPVYLLIQDNEVYIKNASFIWGKDTSQTEDLLRKEHHDPELKVVSIGIAGENQVPLAVMISDNHAVGKGGLGAVMGSKKLKAIAVRGHGSVTIAKPGLLLKETSRWINELKQWGKYPPFLKYGGISGTGRYGEKGLLAVHNNTSGFFPHADKFDKDIFYKFILRGSPRACFACPLPCIQSYSVESGKYRGLVGENPQVGVPASLGYRCGITNFEATLKCHDQINRLGLCLISIGSVVAFAIECFKNGLIDDKSTEGLRLDWGNEETILALIGQIAHGQGLGKILGLGSKRAGEIIGREADQFAIHVKNMEISEIDPRAIPSWGLGYATSNRGAHHTPSFSPIDFTNFSDELILKMAGTTAVRNIRGTEGVPRLVVYLENFRAISDSMETCLFLHRELFMQAKDLIPIIDGVTGRIFDEEELMKLGERVFLTERLFNLREGLTPAEDTLPKRFISEPILDGPAEGSVCNLQPMLEEYYRLRDWDLKSGYPSERKLKEFAL